MNKRKKVVLLGDSIRLIGYGDPVKESLEGEFDVWQPKDNCRFAQYTLRGLWDWSEEISGADIIHWNNGLWDVCDLFGDGLFTPLDEYVDTMLRIARLLKKRAKTVIFATTTPVRCDNPHNKNEYIAAYNENIVPRLMEMGVVINDLYTPLSEDIDAYIREDDKIHLSDAGIKLATEMVENIIRSEAAKLLGNDEKSSEPQEAQRVGAPI